MLQQDIPAAIRILTVPDLLDGKGVAVEVALEALKVCRIFTYILIDYY
jgi:hypothetical protein